ncbi:MAG: Holliday junction resolvase RuvX [Gammaproteobacteria bacterium]|nr:Holliday junction resolvase RuvX [Gammaproteobacteria bacterium]
MNGAPAVTIMAFDYGLRQIGVAIGNRTTATAQALTTLKANDGNPRWEEVQSLLEEWEPQLLLVGLPLNMDGSSSELSQRSEKFGRRLRGRFALPVVFMDERLSSFAAKQQLREDGHKGDYKNSPADALAAELILRSWLEDNYI